MFIFARYCRAANMFVLIYKDSHLITLICNHFIWLLAKTYVIMFPGNDALLQLLRNIWDVI